VRNYRRISRDLAHRWTLVFAQRDTDIWHFPNTEKLLMARTIIKFRRPEESGSTTARSSDVERKKYHHAGHGPGIGSKTPTELWREHVARGKAKLASPRINALVDAAVGESPRKTAPLQRAANFRVKGPDRPAIYTKPTDVSLAKTKPPLGDEKLKEIAADPSPAPVDLETGDLAAAVAKTTLDRYFKGGVHLLAHDGHFFQYERTEWRSITDDQLKKVVLETLDDVPKDKVRRTAAMMNDVTDILRARQAAGADPFHEIGTPPAIINCLNGELHLGATGNVRFLHHSPKSGLRHTLPITYDEKASCPEYDRALTQIFSKAKAPEELIRHWHEVMGYIIQPTRLHAIIVVMFGEGDNGKTKLVKTTMKLLGPNAAHCGGIQDLGTSRFAIGSLRGKLLFVDDDVNIDARLPDGLLKALSEGKSMMGEEKYKNPLSFEARAVPMLLCNNAPSLQDVSHGMLRRLHIMPFDKVFKGKEKDDGLFVRIWANELPGVLNRALEGLKRLQERDHFELPRDARRAAKKWLEQANLFMAFIDDACEREPSGRASMKTVYERFINWAKSSGITKPVTRPQLKRDLQHAGFEVKKSNGDVVVYGLKLK
jgi:putative DNA primase/helicase